MKKGEYIPEIKVILLGDSVVGKTSMLARFRKEDVREFHVATIGIENFEKILNLKDSKKKVQLKIYDTSGQERYRSITRNYYKHTDGILLMYDITNGQTFKSLESWIKEIEERTKPNIPIYLIGNKKELSEEREITYDEGKEFADKHNFKFFETSTKEDKNVQIILEQIAEDICTSNKIFEKKEEDILSHKLDKTNIIRKKKKKRFC